MRERARGPCEPDYNGEAVATVVACACPENVERRGRDVQPGEVAERARPTRLRSRRAVHRLQDNLDRLPRLQHLARPLKSGPRFLVGFDQAPLSLRVLAREGAAFIANAVPAEPHRVARSVLSPMYLPPL